MTLFYWYLAFAGLTVVLCLAGLIYLDRQQRRDDERR